MAKRSCPWGWSHLNGRCFKYFSTCRTWTQAERDCLSMEANLASVHNYEESVYINGLISASGDGYAEVWIGATDAQEDNIWFWSDGSKFQDANWCNNQPNNFNGNQKCVIMNHGASSCWGDRRCTLTRPYVCVKKNC
uniref:C-type lectin domain-containing protein n=1 Tax=Cyprinodon variegatus TaxID=28743 RepID=A0A3Q2DP59_CYPVA